MPNKESTSWLSLILNAPNSLLSFNVFHRDAEDYYKLTENKHIECNIFRAKINDFSKNREFWDRKGVFRLAVAQNGADSEHRKRRTGERGGGGREY